MACGLVSTGLDRDTAHQFESAPHCAPLPAAALIFTKSSASVVHLLRTKSEQHDLKKKIKMNEKQ